MTTQPPDLKKLREVAEKATPGPWTYSNAAGEWVIRGADNKYLGGLMKGTRQLANTASFIATFNPQAILALLDAYEASARDAEILRTAMERLARAPGCGCSPICRCGEGDWTRYELEGRMGDAQQALYAARHATQGD